jgi:hypothetical protein
MKQGRGRGLSYYHYCKMAGKTGKYDKDINQNGPPVGQKSKPELPGLQAGVSATQ